MEFLNETAYQRLLANRSRDGGEAGAAWVKSLPQRVRATVAAWSLTLEAPFENLSYNYVAPVTTAAGEAAVLKLCPPGDDFLCEAEALRAFDGRGCSRLLDLNRDGGAMLLERLRPGLELHTLADDAAETSAVAAVMRELHRPYGGLFPFPHATAWLEDALRPDAIPGLKARHPWLGRALDRLAALTAEPYEAVLLHGDLHHDNVLASTRAPWLAIDPHGVIGDPAWEIAPFLFNRLERYARDDWPALIRRRTDQLAEELSLPRERVYAWSAVRAIQSAFWSLRDAPSNDGPVFDGALICAQVLMQGQRT